MYIPHLRAKVVPCAILDELKDCSVQTLNMESGKAERYHKKAENFPPESQVVNPHSKRTKKTPIQ